LRQHLAVALEQRPLVQQPGPFDPVIHAHLLRPSLKSRSAPLPYNIN
jgi:hypothetical protein